MLLWYISCKSTQPLALVTHLYRSFIYVSIYKIASAVDIEEAEKKIPYFTYI